ncbi:helix-turn-helix domain-containing protein [Streptomycetaceae bacterium NBC_01309]
MAETAPLLPSTADPSAVAPVTADRLPADPVPAHPVTADPSTADRVTAGRAPSRRLRSVDPTADRPNADRSGAAGSGPGKPAPRPAAAPAREPLWRHVLGDQFRSLRHERRETLVETAGRAGVSPQYLSEVERGIKEPSSEMIAALAGALGVTLVDLTIAVSEHLRSAAPVGVTAAVHRSPVCRAAYALAV